MDSEPVTALGRREFIGRAAWVGAGTLVATGLGRVLPFESRGAARAAAGVREIALEARDASGRVVVYSVIGGLAILLGLELQAA